MIAASMLEVSRVDYCDIGRIFFRNGLTRTPVLKGTQSHNQFGLSAIRPSPPGCDHLSGPTHPFGSFGSSDCCKPTTQTNQLWLQLATSTRAASLGRSLAHTHKLKNSRNDALQLAIIGARKSCKIKAKGRTKKRPLEIAKLSRRILIGL